MPSTPMKIPSPFPQRLQKKNDNDKFKKLIVKLRNISINIPGNAKSIKDLMSKKKASGW